MALTINRDKSWRRHRVAIAIWIIGLLAFTSAPFTQALTALAPQRTSSNIAKFAKNSAQKTITGSSLPVTKGTTSTTTSPTSSNASASALPTSCVAPRSIPSGLEVANSPELRKLAEYDQVCNSGVIGTLSFFTPIPTTNSEAKSYASDVIAELNEFSAKGIQALVFLEPTTASGGLIDMNTYNSGAYDSVLDTYFADIKAGGINDSMMGTWVPFPEGNIPEWTSVDPNVFTAAVTKTVTFQKKYFPTSKASILLDSQSYPTGASWGGGSQVSLLPYVQNMPAGLLDSFGLQGFPWVPPANVNESTNGEPQSYLRVDFAAQAARSLNVHTIWLNTGTFGVAYAGQGSSQVTITPARRSQLLTEVTAQASVLKGQGFQVAVHLFAQDKSSTDEATNWSYWSTGQTASSPATTVFKSFVHQLQVAGVSLWLFDSND